MIQFFRTIRKNLLNEGKTSNYLKYAVGEVILVVIGILIALQINNWSEGRKNNKARIYYTHALIADLQKDSLILSFEHKQIRESLDILDNLSIRLSNTFSTVDTLNKIIKEEWDPRFTANQSVNNNTFTTLTSTGHLDFFDRSVTESIQNYYRIANDFSEFQNSFNEFYRNALIPFAANMPMADGEALMENQIIKPGPLKEALWKETDMKKARTLFNGLTTIQYSMFKGIESFNTALQRMNQQLVNTLKSSLK